MAGVVGLEVLKGVLIAIAAAGVYLLARVSRPSDALLGSFLATAMPSTSCIASRMRGPCRVLPFTSCKAACCSSISITLRDRIRWIVSRLPQSTRYLILNAEAVTTIDSTADAVLAELVEELARRNLRFGIANLHGQPRELLARSGLLATIGPDMVFARVEDVARAFRTTQPLP